MLHRFSETPRFKPYVILAGCKTRLSFMLRKPGGIRHFITAGYIHPRNQTL